MRPVPAHVPPEMVGDFSLFTSPGMDRTANGDPQAAAAVALNGPRIFYSQMNTRDGRGTWVVTRADDQRRVLQDSHDHIAQLPSLRAVRCKLPIVFNST